MPKKPPTPKPKARGVTPTQMRLEPEIKAKIEAIRVHFGLSSMAEVVRFAVNRVHQDLPRKGKPKQGKAGDD